MTILLDLLSFSLCISEGRCNGQVCIASPLLKMESAIHCLTTSEYLYKYCRVYNFKYYNYGRDIYRSTRLHINSCLCNGNAQSMCWWFWLQSADTHHQ